MYDRLCLLQKGHLTVAMETAGDWVISDRSLGHGMCGVVREGRNARTHVKVFFISLENDFTPQESLTGRLGGGESRQSGALTTIVH